MPTADRSNGGGVRPGPGFGKDGKKRQAARMLEIKGERAGREGPGNAGGPGIRARGVGNTGRGTRTEGGPGKH